MKELGELIQEKNIELDTIDPVALHGFTQVPNFLLNDPDVSMGATVLYSKFLQYAWYNDFCFPGQERIAAEMGISVGRVSQFTKELQDKGMITIVRRGQGKTNLYKVHFQVKKKGG